MATHSGGAGDRLVVASFDIGTSYSGYAYSLRSDFLKDPTIINTSPWQDSDAGMMSHKAPSTILLDKVMNFDSFGYEAERKFAELAENEESEAWFYFKDFKMKLLQKSLHKEMLIKDIHGKPFPVVGLLTETIKFLKGHMEKEFKKREVSFLEENTLFVITVPAIWSDAAKQVMRLAAERAGIKHENLMLAYEPEVAAIFCRYLAPEKLLGSRIYSDKTSLFQTGVTFMVVDLGGGTVDVTVQRITPNGKLSQVHQPSGGYWGGTTVNQKFMEFLSNIFTEEVIVDFCMQELSEFLDISRTFELKKREINAEKSSDVKIKIPASLVEIYKEKNEKDIKESLKSIYDDRVTLKRGKLEIRVDVFRSFFEHAVDNILKHLQTVLKNPDCWNISFMLLVGGFAECSLVSEAIRKEFPTLKIIIPAGSDCGLAVLKGAAIFGRDPSIVESRVCPYTYGIAVHKPYLPEVHSLSKTFVMDGKLRTEDCFEKLFTAGEIIPIRCKRSITVHNTHYDDERQQWRREHKEIELYSSDYTDPTYVTDLGCKLHGTILVAPPGGLWPVVTEGEVEVEVGGTEILVRYVDKKYNHTVSGTVDFLPREETCRAQDADTHTS